MQTDQQQTPDHEMTDHEVTATSRRSWAIAVAVVLVVAVAAVGAWAVLDDDSSDDPESMATQLIDTWEEAWMEDDLDAVMSVFTDDGVYINVYQESISMDEMPAFFADFSPGIVEAQRTSDVEETGDGTYAWTGQIVDAVGDRWELSTELELDGDLASRIENLSTRPLQE